MNFNLILGAALALAVAPALAGTNSYPSQYQQNAAGVCQAALPGSSSVRARPLGLQNEGTGTVFVTCSPPYDDEAAEQPNAGGLYVFLTNNSGTNISVTCTLVSGTLFGGEYVAKSVTVFANQYASMQWVPSEFAGNPATIYAPNLSCGLPPGIAVSYVTYHYDRRAF